MRWWLVLLLAAMPAWAHEGHDHGDAPPAASFSSGPPRAAARGDDVEAVAVLDAGRLMLYLDAAATNEPLAKAKIDIESGGFKAAASKVAPGVFQAAAQPLASPGRHALTVVVQSGPVNDLLSLTLDVPAMPAAAPATRSWALGPSLWWLAGGAAALTIAAAVFARQRRRQGPAEHASHAAAAIVLNAAAILFGSGTPATGWAHGGEDHNHDSGPMKTAPAQPPTAAVVHPSFAQRLPDGSVFMPKPVQYQLSIRHQVARPGEHPSTLEFSGRVVADPAASGRVQATQSGRIDVGPQGLPVLGQRVAKGQVLATLRPSAAAIERGNQRALRAELQAQRAIAQRRLARLEQLEGAVPRKDVEAARIELDALNQRIEAVGASLEAAEPLRAPVSGVVAVVNVVAGQVVDARETLLEIVDPSRLAVEALAHDPVLPKDLASASADVGGRVLPLQFVGAGRQLREQAMPLLFRIRSPDAVLAVGQPLKVIAKTTRKTNGVAVPRAALVRLTSGEMGVWIHAEAERFVQRRVASQPLDGETLLLTVGVAGGERVVTVGASLLLQVR